MPPQKKVTKVASVQKSEKKLNVNEEDFKSCLIKALSSDDIIDAIASKMNTYLELLVEEKVASLRNEFRSESVKMVEKVNAVNSKQMDLFNERLEDLGKINQELKIKINNFEQQALDSTFVLKGADLRTNAAEKANPKFSPSKETVAKFFSMNLNTSILESDLKSMKIVRLKNSFIPLYIFEVYSNEAKQKIFKQRKLLKGKGIYIEENLTEVNRSIMYHARKMKREKKIDDCFVLKGKMLIKCNGEVKQVHSLEALQLIGS